ncbi:MAG: globin domain-containing protein [Maribacter sp.]|nr:globin domain-containing protein [Maribacter sp.]
MEQTTIDLVQGSFEKVKPISETAGKIFYAKLFELDSSLRAIFPTGEEAIAAQGNKLMTMIASAVAGLNNLEMLVPVLENLGKRHVEYKVEDSHYDTVGAALLSTLETGLGDDFTPEVKDAWASVYGTMASVMINAGK